MGEHGSCGSGGGGGCCGGGHHDHDHGHGHEHQHMAGGIPAARPFSAKYILAIASGKGGVGKSTVSVNTAYTLARKGYKVGLLDADIYGPSVGKMVGLNGPVEVEITADNKILPIERFGVKLMSFSFLIEENKAVAWRGPMLGKALEQFLFDIEWGNLDYLVVDLPPGTGDVQLSLSQLVQVDGAIIVSTPQTVALIDAGRAVNMFQSVRIPILGVVENMSVFVCPSCGEKSHIFSEGGGAALAKSSRATLLGEIPITPALMEAGEKGLPLTIPDLAKHAKDLHQASAEAITAAYDKIVSGVEKILSEREAILNAKRD